MAFNPTLPVANSPMRSEEMRNQFTGLKDLIDQKLDAPETDPVFAGSEAALFVAGDKAKLDAAALPKAGTITINPATLGVARQPSLTTDTLVIASIHAQCDNVGSGGIAAYVGETAGQLAHIGRVSFAGSGEIDGMLMFVVPVGWWYKFLDISNGADSAASLAYHTEYPLNL